MKPSSVQCIRQKGTLIFCSYKRLVALKNDYSTANLGLKRRKRRQNGSVPKTQLEKAERKMQKLEKKKGIIFETAMKTRERRILLEKEEI